MPLAWLRFAAPASSMDSGLARGSAPWTPGGYIPVSNILFIPVPNILFIPVSNILFIPVPNILFISVPNMLFIPNSNPLFIPVPNMLFIQSPICCLSHSPICCLSQSLICCLPQLSIHCLSQSATHCYPSQLSILYLRGPQLPGKSCKNSIVLTVSWLNGQKGHKSGHEALGSILWRCKQMLRMGYGSVCCHWWSKNGENPVCAWGEWQWA